MKYRNSTGRVVNQGDPLTQACQSVDCRNCRLMRAAQKDDLATCDEYAEKHGEKAAFALLGFYPEKDGVQRFRLEDFPGRYAMHCKTDMEAKIFCGFLNKSGRTLAYCKQACHEDTYWRLHKENTCYFFNEGLVGTMGSTNNHGYTVLEFSNFDWSKELTQEPVREGRQTIYCTFTLPNEDAGYLLRKSMEFNISATEYLIKLLEKDMGNKQDA